MNFQHADTSTQASCLQELQVHVVERRGRREEGEEEGHTTHLFRFILSVGELFSCNVYRYHLPLAQKVWAVVKGLQGRNTHKLYACTGVWTTFHVKIVCTTAVAVSVTHIFCAAIVIDICSVNLNEKLGQK